MNTSVYIDSFEEPAIIEHDLGAIYEEPAVINVGSAPTPPIDVDTDSESSMVFVFEEPATADVQLDMFGGHDILSAFK